MASPPEKASFSCEFFPPKSDDARDRFWETLDTLAALGPSFVTMTYGAGGSTRDWTLEMAIAMQERTGVPAAAHLTFVGTPRDELMTLADMLWGNGIRHVVALRGDMPPDLSWPLAPDPDYFQYTSDFVMALKERHDFDISVGAYPEKHPDAPSLSADIAALKLKCDSGATRAITQFFFENDAYFRFLELARAQGIQTPIVPGLLPIGDFSKIAAFAARCETHVPDALSAGFERLSPEETGPYATEILNCQVRGLLSGGVDHVHFYTLNKADTLADTIKACFPVKERL